MNEFVYSYPTKVYFGKKTAVDGLAKELAGVGQTVMLAYEEQAEAARPTLRQAADVEGYDIIFLGFPNWWGDLPMPLYTFLEETDLSGKTIIPFVTHGGNGFSATVDTIASLQPQASVSDQGLSISCNDVSDAQGTVSEWLSGLEASL